MIINGQDFKVYDLDTDRTISQRIAAKLNTLSEYLYPEYHGEGAYQDVLEVIKLMSPQEFEEEFGLDSTLLKLYIIYYIESEFLQHGLELPYAYLFFETTNFDNNVVQRTMSERVSIIDAKDLAIQNNIRAVEEDLNFFEIIDRLPANVSYSGFIEEKVTKRITIVISKPYSSLFLFDSILDTDVSLAIAKLDNRLIYKSSGGRAKTGSSGDMADNELKIYLSDAEPFVITVGSTEIVIEYDVKVEAKTKRTKREALTNDRLIVGTLLTILNIEYVSYTIRESKVKGSFNLNFGFSKDCLLDLIMSCYLFRSLYSDERLKVTKHLNSIKLYFASQDFISFSLAPLPDDKTRCYISSIERKAAIPRFQKLLSKLASIYLTKEAEIMAAYKAFGILLTKPSKQSKAAKNPLLEISDMFVPLYSRKCSNAPLFAESEASKTYNMPFLGRTYTCDHHPKHPYPGLIVNSLSNKDKYPFLPCCFTSDQRHRRGGPYRHVFNDEPLNTDKTDHAFYKTTKHLPPKSYGFLPRGISDIFITSRTLERFGVSITPASFIDCVSYATELEVPSRHHLASDAFIGISRQESFDITPEALKDWIIDETRYFDPNVMISIVEEYFEVSIFLFFKDASTPSGVASLPHRSGIGNYLRRPLKDRCVFIYEHIEGAPTSTPRCELIVERETSNFTFDSGSKEVLLILELQKQMIGFTSHSNPPTPTVGPVSRQQVDYSGKTIAIDNRRLDAPTYPLFLPLYEPKVDSSTFQEYITKRKIANLFFNYTLREFWILGQSIVVFTKERCIVKKDHVLRLPSTPYYDDYKQYFTYKDKIVFQSKLLLLKVMYNISLLAKRISLRQRQKWLDPMVASYYENISDFRTQGFIVSFASLKPKVRKTMINTLEEIDYQSTVVFSNTFIENGSYFVGKRVTEVAEGTTYVYNGTGPFDAFQSMTMDSVGQKSAAVYVIYKLASDTYILELTMIDDGTA